MSSVSSVSANGADLFSWLRQIGQQPDSTTQVANAPTTPQDPAADSTAQGPGAPAGGAGHHHHHHGFASKIESAVTSALQSAPSGSDPNQVIKDAITQALQGGKAGGKPGAAGPDGGDQAGGATATSADGTTSANGSSSSSSFVSLLQSFGVDAQQFQQDLQGALTGQQADGSVGSGVDFAKLFKSFPPGSLLQATG